MIILRNTLNKFSKNKTLHATLCYAEYSLIRIEYSETIFSFQFVFSKMFILIKLTVGTLNTVLE
jgi:hypothetical protein